MDCSMNWDVSQVLASKLDAEEWAVRNLVLMLDQGDTIPFIARYRKEKTGDMKVEKIRDVKHHLDELRAVETKVTTVMKAVDKLGKLTAELSTALRSCHSMTEVDSLYAPYKPGHKGTLAERARALGLEPLAQLCLKNPVRVDVAQYIQPDKKGLSSKLEVETGVKHILADIMSKDKEVIDLVTYLQNDPTIELISTEAKGLKKKLKEKKEEKQGGNKNSGDDPQKYHLYFDFKLILRHLKPHQVLAINRGEEHKILSVHCNFPARCRQKFVSLLQRKFILKNSPAYVQNLLFASIEDCYDRLVQPAMVRHIRSDLKKNADKASIDVFASNLKNLLLTQPTRGKCIMGIDPGFKNGCKIAVILETGKVSHTDKIYLQNKAAKLHIMDIVSKHRCDILAIGDGHGCRETEQLVSEVIKENKLQVLYSIVTESGASIYSVSEVAQKDLPDLDPTLRGAVSIARRLQDPLAEFLKVEPKHLGVGQYQHDMPEKQLHSTLDSVVEECVSFVGVDLNTASEHLLKRIAGLNAARAKKIVEWRESNGSFVNRQQIRTIKGIGEKSFEQCAGFVRIHNSHQPVVKKCEDEMESGTSTGRKRKATSTKTGKSKRARIDADVPNPLDMTAIHPEAYSIAQRLIEKIGVNVGDIGSSGFIKMVKNFGVKHSVSDLASEHSAGEPTIQLILDALQQTLTYDFREAFAKPLYLGETRSVRDLKVGKQLTGKVKNVTHFGAFVDIGVEYNGLVHHKYMKGTTLQLGNTVSVKVLSLELDRKRIGLEFMALL